MNQFKSAAYKSPLIISGVYLFFSALWIAFSDQWVLNYVDDPVQITTIQTYKGWFFISLSAVVIYFLVLTSNKNFIKLFDRHLSVQKSFNDELEKQVADRTFQLEQINEELESFSYSVSHDLRSPLRAISGYTTLLVEDYKEKLDQKGEQFLGIIKSEVIRMGELIDDLLSFSRISRTGLKISSFDMNELVDSCIVELKRVYPDKDVEFKLEELDDTDGDPALLKQVWTNLLDNAIKYQKRDERAFVQIGCRSEHDSNQITYFIKDKGVGFDMEYADKLFGVFQRLHPKEEFDGTGIGLALVKRIVNRHHGHVWAESELNSGSTFYFSLPMNISQSQKS